MRVTRGSPTGSGQFGRARAGPGRRNPGRAVRAAVTAIPDAHLRESSCAPLDVESWCVGKRGMDDEQRERMHDLKRSTWRGVLTGGAFLVFAIVAGVFLLDDWTAFLFPGTTSLVLTIVMSVSHWRYIRRGPFPRLPVSMRDGTTPSSDSFGEGMAGGDRTAGQGG